MKTILWVAQVPDDRESETTDAMGDTLRAMPWVTGWRTETDPHLPAEARYVIGPGDLAIPLPPKEPTELADVHCPSVLTTATVTDEEVADRRANEFAYWTEMIPDGMTVKRVGDRLVKVDLHSLECSDGDGDHAYDHGSFVEDGQYAYWVDGTPGAGKVFS